MALTGPDNIGLQRWRRFFLCVLAAMLVITVTTVSVVYAFGHRRSARSLGIALVIVIAWTGIVAAFAWRRMSRNQEMQRLMEHSWRARRRVGKELRKRQPIAAEDRAVARSIIDVQKRHRWYPRVYLALGVIWVLNAAVAHGSRRWIDLALGLLYLALTPFLWRTRRKILSREADLGAADNC